MTGWARNLANLVVVLRVLLVLIAIVLLDLTTPRARLSGLALMTLAALLDGVDGYLARRLKTVSTVGAQLDTLGDRITENVLFIFLAVRGLVSFWVPVVFVTRSFFADFIRSLHGRHGAMGTFAMNTSRFGQLLVASKTSRAGYLMLKFAVFLAGGLILALSARGPMVVLPDKLVLLQDCVWWGGVLATGMNLLRFWALLYDSRTILSAEFGR